MVPRHIRSLSVLVALACTFCNGNDWHPSGTDGAPESSVPDGGDTACTDRDGDGHGVGCSQGPDCDDTDSAVHTECPHCLAGPAEGCTCSTGTSSIDCYEGPSGTAGIGICAYGTRSCVDEAWTSCLGQTIPLGAGETCNELDDDCDGETDEGVGGECGSCDPYCVADSVGQDGETAWDPSDDHSEGVRVDEESGALVLDSTSVNTFTIWVANSAEGTVSKVDVRTYEEIGRFWVGTDPSRTSVNTLGDVYVGLRNGYGVVKISTLGEDCPDANGDGIVTTSTGHDVLPAGTDECVLWTTPLPGCGLIRGVAAQDEFGPDGEIRSYVWVGGYNGCLWKIDGETGAILVNATPAPSYVYGLALDGHGNLWSSGRGAAILGRTDTSRCVDDASCADPVCSGEGAGDDCVKQAISTPINPYGITVDLTQRVWIGGGSGSGGGGPCRYDTTAAAASRWVCAGVSTFVGGIAADAEGWVWAAGTGWAFGGAQEVFRVNGEDPSQWTNIPEAAGFSNHGAAVDAEGKVWFINYGHNHATVITPGATLHENAVETAVSPIFNSPYTYSDMTGSQLRFVNPRGYYRTIFAGCDEMETEWGELDAETWLPDRTTILVRVRFAETPEALADVEWTVAASLPGDVFPLSLPELIAAAGLASGRYLEVEIQLVSEVSDGSEPVTPSISSMGVTHRCPVDIT